MEELKSPQGLAVLTVSKQPAEVRAQFFKKTYFHLGLAILTFIVNESILLNTEWIVRFTISMLEGWRWLFMLLGFYLATSLAEKWCMNYSAKSIQYAALVLFVFAEAFLFVPLIYIGIAITGDASIISQAALLTLFLFAGISGVVFLTGKDFSMLKIFQWVGGLLAMGLIIVGAIFNFSLGIWFSFAMVGIAAAAILYQSSISTIQSNMLLLH